MRAKALTERLVFSTHRLFPLLMPNVQNHNRRNRISEYIFVHLWFLFLVIFFARNVMCQENAVLEITYGFRRGARLNSGWDYEKFSQIAMLHATIDSAINIRPFSQQQVYLFLFLHRTHITAFGSLGFFPRRVHLADPGLSSLFHIYLA